MERKRVELVSIEVDGEFVDAKECTKCGVVKQLSEFNKRPRGLGGKDSRCRVCYNKQTKNAKSEYDKKYREENKEVIADRKKKYHADNREIISKKKKDWYESNKEAHLAKCREWALKNKEKVLVYSRKSSKKYRENNPDYVEKCRVKSKEKYQENKEEYAERWKKYYDENKDWLLDKQKEYYHQNKERFAARWKKYYRSPRGQEVTTKLAHKRRAMEKESIATLTNTQWKDCKKYFNNACAYCGSEGRLSKDHFVPVSKGGDLVVTNVVPACLSCNSSKQAKNFFDWYPDYFHYSSARETKILKYLGIKEDNTQQLAMF